MDPAGALGGGGMSAVCLGCGGGGGGIRPPVDALGAAGGCGAGSVLGVAFGTVGSGTGTATAFGSACSGWASVLAAFGLAGDGLGDSKLSVEARRSRAIHVLAADGVMGPKVTGACAVR